MKLFQKNKSQESQKSHRLIIKQLERDFYVTFVTFCYVLSIVVCDFFKKSHIKVTKKSCVNDWFLVSYKKVTFVTIFLMFIQ